MKIADLCYLENASTPELILGGSNVLGITADAIAEGSDTLTSTNTTTNIRRVGNGKVTIGKGEGEAFAIGRNPFAAVDFYTVGFDRVKVKTTSVEGNNYAYQSLKIIAIDTPGK